MKIFVVLAANILCFAVVFCVFHGEGLPKEKRDVIEAILYTVTPVITIFYIVDKEIAKKKDKPAATTSADGSGKADTSLLISGHDVRQIHTFHRPD